MENQETREPQNENTSETPATHVTPATPATPATPMKNPKRVAAGKKGAEARRKKALKTLQEPDLPVRVTKELPAHEPEIKVNVYKNYVPLCAALIMAVGIGLYLTYGKTETPKAPKLAVPAPVSATHAIDPFEMR